MTIRRYAKPKQSRGTVLPADVRRRVHARDASQAGGCVGFGRFPGPCEGGIEQDHCARLWWHRPKESLL